MSDVLLSICVVLGSVFVLLASVGVLRFRDAYQRMHAATKAGAFGGAILALSAGVHFGEPMVWVKVMLMIAFFYSTMPVAAHLIARAGRHSGVKPVPETDTKPLDGFER